MKTFMMGALVCGALCGSPVLSMAQSPVPGPDMVLVRPTAKSTDEVVDAIKSYVEGKKWLYMGASKAKNGEVTMVKVCIPQIGQMLWPVGLHLSALLPCGNLGVYGNKGKTEISMLHPQYMQVLYPHPEVEKASAAATPLLMAMLEAVSK